MSLVRLHPWFLIYVQSIIVYCKYYQSSCCCRYFCIIWGIHAIAGEQQTLLFYFLTVSLRSSPPFCSCSTFCSVKMCIIRMNRFSLSNSLSLLNLTTGIINGHLTVLHQKVIWRVRSCWCLTFWDGILSKAFCS